MQKMILHRSLARGRLGEEKKKRRDMNLGEGVGGGLVGTVEK